MSVADSDEWFAVAVEAVEQWHEVEEDQRRKHSADDHDGQRALRLRADLRRGTRWPTTNLQIQEWE